MTLICWVTWSFNTGMDCWPAWLCNYYILILLAAPPTLALWPVITALWSSFISTMENMMIIFWKQQTESEREGALTFRAWVEGRKCCWWISVEKQWIWCLPLEICLCSNMMNDVNVVFVWMFFLVLSFETTLISLISANWIRQFPVALSPSCIQRCLFTLRSQKHWGDCWSPFVFS